MPLHTLILCNKRSVYKRQEIKYVGTYIHVEHSKYFRVGRLDGVLNLGALRYFFISLKVEISSQFYGEKLMLQLTFRCMKPYDTIILVQISSPHP